LTERVDAWPLVEAKESDLRGQFWGMVELLKAKGTQWVNEPATVLQASKITELFHASRVGFNIPNTVITAHEPELAMYIKENNLIVKSLQSQSVSLSKKEWLSSYTKTLSQEQVDLIQQRRSLNAPPVIIQPFIKKS